VTAVRILGRILAIVGGLVLFAFGVAALGVAYLPDSEVARVAGRLAVGLGAAALGSFGSTGDPREVMAAIQSGFAMRFVAAPVGLIALVAALLPGSPRLSESEIAEGGTLAPDGNSGLLRKARRHAANLSKRQGALAAAEFCFDNGLMQEAAEYFIEAEQWARAAEIRHDEARFIESAELFMKAERFDAAGRIFAQQEENGRAGDAYYRAGNHGIAAELFEKAGEHLKAAESYDASGYSRQAAQAYVKCGQWEKAAICLEQSIVEEATGGRSDGVKGPAVQKLVRMAGNLFERAGLFERAEAVLVRGECFAAAAEIALRQGRDEVAVDLFLRAKDAPRAAEVMTRLGQVEEAARVLAEHHRDLGDDEEAARCFEKSGELLAAGDIYRMLEQYERAGECYERFGDFAQAAEMFSMAGDRARGHGARGSQETCPRSGVRGNRLIHTGLRSVRGILANGGQDSLRFDRARQLTRSTEVDLRYERRGVRRLRARRAAQGTELLAAAGMGATATGRGIRPWPDALQPGRGILDGHLRVDRTRSRVRRRWLGATWHW